MERNQENARQVRLQRGAGDPHAGRRPMTARPRGSATRPHAPGPGGHPAPSGRSAGTRLPVGSAGWNRQRRGDFTPPSWDPAARYRQPCTSCLKTQGRERARETRVLAEWREGRRPAGREGRGAAGCISAVPLAMVCTRRPPRGRRHAHTTRAAHATCTHTHTHTPHTPQTHSTHPTHAHYLHTHTPHAARALPASPGAGVSSSRPSVCAVTSSTRAVGPTGSVSALPRGLGA